MPESTAGSETLIGSESGQQGQHSQNEQQQTGSGFVGDDGKFKDGWLDRLPPEFADSKQMLGSYKDLPSALKSLIEAQKLVGKKTDGMIRIPGALKEGASDAEKTAHSDSVSAFRKALGIPEKAEGYGLKPDQLPEGIVWDDAFDKQVSEIAHKNNIPPSAMKEIVGAYIGMEQSRVTAQVQLLQKQLEDGKSTLQNAWKGNFDSHLQTATRVAKTLGLDVNSPGLRDPNVILALQRVAGMVSEDKIVKGEFSTASSTPGKDRGMAIITGKSSDAEVLRLHKAYMDGDKEANKMVEQLLANG